MMYVGMGQYSADTGLNTPLDTSGVQIVAPTFVGPCQGGAVMNPQTGACVMPQSPTPYVDPGSASASSPTAANSSTILYIALGLLAAFVLPGLARGKR